MDQTLRDTWGETNVLATVLRFGQDCFYELDGILTPETFVIPENQTIWHCLDWAFKQNDHKTIDQTVLGSAAAAINQPDFFKSPDLAAHLRAIERAKDGMAESARPEALKIARGLRKLWVARKLRDTLEGAAVSMNGATTDWPLDKILATAEDPVFTATSELAATAGQSVQRLGEGVETYLQYLQDRQGAPVGLSTGFTEYDAAIGGGLRRKTVNLIGARPKTGKTVFGANVALYVSRILGVPVLYLDTEMSREDHLTRLICCLTHGTDELTPVTINELERFTFAEPPKGEVTAEGKPRLSGAESVPEAGKILKDLELDFVSIAGQPFEETLGLMRRWVAKKVGRNQKGKVRDCLIVFDYLKLMSSETLSAKNLQEYQAMGFMATALHNFAVAWDVPILAFVQLNREHEVSQSDRLIWLASNWSIFERVDESQQLIGLERYERRLVPKFQRHGAGLKGEDHILFNFYGPHAHLTEAGRFDVLDEQARQGTRPKVQCDPNDEVPTTAEKAERQRQAKRDFRGQRGEARSPQGEPAGSP
jgi:replicative DNA helicase